MEKTMESNKHKKYLAYLYGIIGFIALVIIDQLTKFWAISKLKPLGSEGIPIVEGVLEFLYLENRGAAFGLMQDKQILFILLSAIFMVVAIIVYFRLPNIKNYYPIYFIIVLISSGAVGNLIDRIQYNFVVDFIYFKLIDFPIFNIADIYVVCGGILLFIMFIFIYKEDDLDVLYKYIRHGKMEESK